MEIMATSNEMQTRSDQRMRCGINVAVDKMLRDVESEIHVSNLWFHVCTASLPAHYNCTLQSDTKPKVYLQCWSQLTVRCSIIAIT